VFSSIHKPSQNRHYSLDPVYAELLRLALPCPLEVSEEYLKQAVTTLNQLIRFSDVHWRLVPLLRNKADLLNIFNRLDTDVQSFLIERTQEGVVSELAKQSVLKNILTQFKENQIPVILLKSTGFNGWIYHGSNIRLSNDIDLLVKKEHWQLAIKLLSSYLDYQPKAVQGVLADEYEISFTSAGLNNTHVDLHCALVHPQLFDWNEEMAWETSMSHPSYEDPLVRVLGLEQNLNHLALHAFKDQSFNTYGLVDAYYLYQLMKVDNFSIHSLLASFKENVPLIILWQALEELINEKGSTSSPLSSMRRFMLRFTMSRALRERSSASFVKISKSTQLLALFSFSRAFKGPMKLIFSYLGKQLLKKSAMGSRLQVG